MAKDNYWYPRDIDERAAWHANWNAQLPNFTAKYNIAADKMTQAAADNDWIQYWVAARHTADAIGEQLTKFFNTIATGDEADEPPKAINFALPPDPPAQVAPGIKARTQEIANHIKGNMAYAEADGELLGIVGDKQEPQTAEFLTADFTLRTLANYNLEATFSRNGKDAARFEIRHKGGNWQLATILTSSPGTFDVAPAAPGAAEQIEVRAILVENNQPVGNYSTIHVALIAP